MKIINNKVIAVFIISMTTIISFALFLSNVDKDDIKYSMASINITKAEEKEETLDMADEIGKETNIAKKVIVYKGMAMSELAEKLNRSMKSTLSGKGEVLANRAIEKGVDPYLALGIMLLETGCNSGTCSSLTRKCYNVGGMKGSPGCDGGSYKVFSSIDDGIIAFVDNLARNYYAYGLTTPEAMNRKYAESSTWAMKVRNYMSQIERR